MEESKKELKSLLMKVEEEGEKKMYENEKFRKLRSWHLVPFSQSVRSVIQS